MKRSEAIDSIVYHCLSWDGLDTSGVDVKEIANDILTHVEKLGMLPPYNPQHSDHGSIQDCEWCPEEETGELP